MVEKESFIYDALYAYCEQTIAAAPAK
jgi:hypothetical protein